MAIRTLFPFPLFRPPFSRKSRTFAKERNNKSTLLQNGHSIHVERTPQALRQGVSHVVSAECLVFSGLFKTTLFLFVSSLGCEADEIDRE